MANHNLSKTESVSSAFQLLVTVVDQDHIDTDQIIPAEFLKTTQKQGLGQHLFANWKGQTDNDYFHQLENHRQLVQRSADPAVAAHLLVVGENFGCGSSREHAVWALMDFGVKVIVGRSFADIFRSNAQKNGLLLVTLENEAHQALDQANGRVVAVDLSRQRLQYHEQQWPFALEPFVKYCFIHQLDELDYILNQTQAIEAFEAKRQKSTTHSTLFNSSGCPA